MLTVEGDVRHDVFVKHAEVVIDRWELVDIELVVDFTNPARASSHNQVRTQRISVVQQKRSADVRVITQTFQRVGENDNWVSIESLAVEGVAPLRVVNAL